MKGKEGRRLNDRWFRKVRRKQDGSNYRGRLFKEGNQPVCSGAAGVRADQATLQRVQTRVQTDNKEVVLALREVAAGKVSPARPLKDDFQPQAKAPKELKP